MSIGTIAAVGSSFAAGPGIEPYENRAAYRSHRNYAHQLAERFGADLTDLTVSGATTANIIDTPQQTREGTVFPPQLSGLPTAAELVTVTAGGNDLGFLGTLVFLALSKVAPDSPILPLLQSEAHLAPVAFESAPAEQTIGGLVRIVDAVRVAAPNARVVLVDYLTILEDGANVDEYFTADEVTGMLTTQQTLRRVFVAAAEQTGVDLVTASALSAGHGLGSADPWVQPLSLDYSTMSGSFHPTEAGMAAVAAEIERHLTA